MDSRVNGSTTDLYSPRVVMWGSIPSFDSSPLKNRTSARSPTTSSVAMGGIATWSKAEARYQSACPGRSTYANVVRP